MEEHIDGAALLGWVGVHGAGSHHCSWVTPVSPTAVGHPGEHSTLLSGPAAPSHGGRWPHGDSSAASAGDNGVGAVVLTA